MPIKVLLADDSDVMRLAIRRISEEESRIEAIASVVRAKAAMRGHFKTGHMEWPGT